MAQAAATGDAPQDPAKQRNAARFSEQLEMVQALANPFYLSTLAQQGILDDPAFVAYLDYLRYWKEPRYVRFVTYPVALHMLDLLQEPAFRENLKHEGTAAEIAEQLVRHWATWRVPKQKSTGSSAPSAAAAT